MTINDLKAKLEFFRPALALEAAIGSRTRAIIADMLAGAVSLLAIPSAIYFLARFSPLSESSFFLGLGSYIFLLKILTGVFLLVLALWLFVVALQAYFYSHYFKALDGILSEPGIVSGDGPISFEVAWILYHSKDFDVTPGFVQSVDGQTILLRLGITDGDIQKFLAERKVRLPAASFKLESFDKEFGFTLADLSVAIFREDQEFSKMLFGKGVQEKELLEAALWQVRINRRQKRSERWWSRDNLGRIEGFGKDWAYGVAYVLERYTKHSFSKRFFEGTVTPYIREEVEELEEVLVKKREANALLVGEAGGIAYDVILYLARMVHTGEVLPALEHKQLIILDANKLVSGMGEKSRFESELLKLLEDARKAGNIILVIDDLPSFVQSAAALGSDIVNLMDPYLNSEDIQFVALSDTDRFRKIIEPNGALLERFETILVKGADEANSIRIIEDEVIRYEKSGRLFFTYKSIVAIVESAERYFPEGVMPDKALDLLAELVPKLLASGGSFLLVQGEDVLALVQSKTGIALGSVKPEEKQKLINLEEILHKRVVGQNEAISGIASALRRARSGVGNPNRPIGSFLFLGPTGVGKTETTKALAESFFGSENKVLRLDMSEFKSADAMDKLIGSFATGKPGVLASLVREHPYGVLLLDEFEKTTKEVLDLFLQILDEGFFSDMAGKKVNARNLIIITTSNAGADKIWEFMKQGGDLMAHKDELVDYVIGQGIFKPELLNRFDGVILFHPIEGENLRQVARLMLERLRARLRERGIDLVVTDALIDYLMKFGSDPKFGARPMNRAIQDKVEQRVADKIIKDEIKTGASVELTEADLSPDLPLTPNH